MVARVRFAPSPLLLPWTEQLGGELQPRHMPVQVRPGAPFAVKVLLEAHRVANSGGPGQFRLTAPIHIRLHRCPSG